MGMIHISNMASRINESFALYQNQLGEGVLTSSSESEDGFIENVLGPQTNDYWTPASLPAWLAVELDSPVECDCAAIVGHTLGSTGTSISLQYFDGLTWVTLLSVSPSNDQDLVLIFEPVSSTGWRMLFEDGDSSPSISVAMVGPRFFFPRGVQSGYVPLNLARTVDLSPSITIRGQYVGTFVKRTGGGTSIPLATQYVSWVEEEAEDFINHYNQGSPFIWASCPGLLPNDLAYCWRDGDTLKGGYSGGSIWVDLTLEVSCYVGS